MAGRESPSRPFCLHYIPPGGIWKILPMNNYSKMQEAARLRFLTYDFDQLCRHPAIRAEEKGLKFPFLGQGCYVNRETGEILIENRKADFAESLTVYDWLCDRKPNAQAANDFCAINSLPGVLVSGGNLELNGNNVAPLIAKNPERFLEICKSMDGKQLDGADLAVVIYPIPHLPVLLKFYEADEEFPPSLSLLWDKNILRFLRYETIYYLAGCLLKRFRGAL